MIGYMEKTLEELDLNDPVQANYVASAIKRFYATQGVDWVPLSARYPWLNKRTWRTDEEVAELMKENN